MRFPARFRAHGGRPRPESEPARVTFFDTEGETGNVGMSIVLRPFPSLSNPEKGNI